MAFTGSIVIVNFNSGRRLGECLDSIAAHAADARVIVVDNASADGSEGSAARRSDRVHLLRNPENAGFARAVNQGLAMTDGDLVLILNPDCRLLADTLDPLTTELTAHAQCAIVAPQVLNEDGSIQGNARGDPNLLTGFFGRSTLLTRVFPGSSLAQRNVHRESSAGPAVSREVEWVSGACMLARRVALNLVDGFDERYFLYWEDADLCRRLRSRGFSIRHVPEAHVVHAAGSSSRTVPTLAVREFHRSAFTYYATHVAKTALMRGIAKAMLAVRCWWKLRASGQS
jgi:GT2 family glycosyltransferase